MSRIEAVLIAVVILVVVYVGLAGFVWVLRNPVCNEAQVFRHPIDVLTFDRTPECQALAPETRP